MQELEEDPELRSRVALYRDPLAPVRRGGAGASEAGGDSDDEFPEVPLEELLEDLSLGCAESSCASAAFLVTWVLCVLGERPVAQHVFNTTC